MKRLFTALMFCCFAVPAMARMSSTQIQNLVGRNAREIVAVPEIQDLLRMTIAQGREDAGPYGRESITLARIKKFTDVSVPSQLVENQYLVAWGCEEHNCGDNRALIVIDITDPNVVLVVTKSKTSPAPWALPSWELSVRSPAWLDKFGTAWDHLPAGITAEMDKM